MKAPHPLRALRDASGLSQQAFADRVSVTQALVSAVERRRARLGRDTALRVKDAFGPEMNRLGLTVEDLLRGGRAAA